MNQHNFEDLIRNGNKFLIQYCKSMYCDKKFAEEFEINLLHLENLHQYFSNLLEITDNIGLSELKIPKINNNIYFPKNYDVDIYVNLNNPITWTKEKDED